jgi:hypothetical protein
MIQQHQHLLLSWSGLLPLPRVAVALLLLKLALLLIKENVGVYKVLNL